jgi:type II secretory pathway component GspD/PulD (secretin)
MKRLWIYLLLLFSLAFAQSLRLTPIGSYDTLLLLASGPVRYTFNAQDRTLLVLDARLEPGQELPEGIEAEAQEEGLLLRFSEPYQVSRSADERRLQIVRLGYLKVTAKAAGDPLQTDERAPLILSLANAAPATVAAQLSQLYANLKIVVDERQRSLMIIVNPADRPLIEAVVRYLDSPRPQVSFEAEVIEINRTATQNLGIDYDFLFKLGIKETDIPTPSGSAPFRFGRFGRDTAQGLGLSATINLLQSTGAGRILARPRVVTMDGLEARINATQNTPLVVNTGTGGTQTVQNIATGVTLRMLPKVAPDGSVEVQVTISVSAPTGVTAQGVPTFSSREATTTVKVLSGEPIVIGGLLESRKIEGVDKVPLLGDIPVVGELFKNTTTNISETDLVIVITPRLLTPGSGQ